MRIAQFITRMDVLGGAQTHVIDLAKGLIENGHEVIVISHGRSDLTNELENLSITYIDMPNLTVPIHPLKDLQTLLHLRTILRQVNPDILAIHSSKAGMIGRLVGTYLKIPTVFTAHSWSFSCIHSSIKKKMFITLERFIGAISKGIITVSHYNMAEAEDYNIAKNINKTVIHNGIMTTSIEQGRSNPNNLAHLVMVARFASPKNHRQLLDALAKLKHRPWKLTLVGGGPLFSEIKSYAKKCGLENRIAFTGESTNVEEILSHADIFVLTSTSEGLPISIIEAMRASLPTVASDVGGIKELIDDSETGYLVDKEDTAELIVALDKLIVHQALRKQLGNHARDKFLREFTVEQMIHETEKYYNQVLLNYKMNKWEVLQR